MSCRPTKAELEHWRRELAKLTPGSSLVARRLKRCVDALLDGEAVRTPPRCREEEEAGDAR